MSEQQIKEAESKKAEGNAAGSSKNQRELTPEQLAGVVGGINPKSGIVGPQDNPE